MRLNFPLNKLCFLILLLISFSFDGRTTHNKCNHTCDYFHYYFRAHLARMESQDHPVHQVRMETKARTERQDQEANRVTRYTKHIWASTWQYQQIVCAPSEDSDQPGHPPSLIRVFATRVKKVWVLRCPVSAQRRLWSDWADAEADLSFRWVYMPICWFCPGVAHISSQK